MTQALPDPWMAMAGGFETGLGLGMQEKRLGIEEKRAQTAEDIAKRKLEISETEHGWAKLDRNKKDIFEEGERAIRKAGQLYKMGKDEEAGLIISNAYNKSWPDGNQMRVVFPARHPELSQSGQLPPEMAQQEIVVISKKHGMIPLKDMGELMKFSAAHFNQQGYLDTLKAAEVALAKKNEEARRSPTQIEDGSWVQDVYKSDRNGVPVFASQVPYEGPIPMSEANKALRSLGIDPHSLTDDDRRVLARLQGPPPSKFQQGITERKMGISERAEIRQAGLAEREVVVKEKEEARKGGIHTKTVLTAKQRADIYVKAEEAFKGEFADEMGALREDAPKGEAKVEWIDKWIERATGIKRPVTEKGKAQAVKNPATDLLKSDPEKFKMLPIEGQKVSAEKKQIEIYRLNDPSTGREIVLWADGTEIVTDKEGNELGRRRIVRTKGGGIKIRQVARKRKKKGRQTSHKQKLGRNY